MRKSISLILNSFIFLILLFKGVSAHCLLCIAEVTLVTGSVVYFGVSVVIVGLFIGAFAVSMRRRIAKIIKKQYIPLQILAIIVLSSALTITVIFSILGTNSPYYFFSGSYESLFNKIYMIHALIW